jgi:hypothetical protein
VLAWLHDEESPKALVRSHASSHLHPAHGAGRRRGAGGAEALDGKFDRNLAGALEG